MNLTNVKLTLYSFVCKTVADFTIKSPRDSVNNISVATVAVNCYIDHIQHGQWFLKFSFCNQYKENCRKIATSHVKVSLCVCMRFNCTKRTKLFCEQEKKEKQIQFNKLRLHKCSSCQVRWFRYLQYGHHRLIAKFHFRNEIE